MLEFETNPPSHCTSKVDTPEERDRVYARRPEFMGCIETGGPIRGLRVGPVRAATRSGVWREATASAAPCGGCRCMTTRRSGGVKGWLFRNQRNRRARVGIGHRRVQWFLIARPQGTLDDSTFLGMTLNLP